MYIRSLDAAVARALPGTEVARSLFWSPDGRSIGFFAGNKLKTIDASGGTVRVICDAVGARSFGDWKQEGVTIFSIERTAPI